MLDKLDAPISKKERQNSGEILRIWIADNQPCITIDPWLFEEQDVGYGLALSHIAAHYADALCQEEKGDYDTIFCKLRDEITMRLEQTQWRLPPFVDYAIDAENRAQELPIPPEAASSADSFEVVRVWLHDPLNESDFLISLRCLPLDQAASVIAITSKLIAQILHHKADLDEDEIFNQIAEQFLQQLEEFESEFVSSAEPLTELE